MQRHGYRELKRKRRGAVDGRRRIRVTGLWAAVVFAIAGFGAASAHAQEASYFQCAKQRGGEYTENACATRDGRGEFEREDAVGAGYTSNTTKVVISTPGLTLNGRPVNVSCKQTKAVGTIVALNRTEEVITFQMCEIPEQGIKYCTSEGRPLGALETNPLEAELVEVSAQEIGSVLTAQGGGGEPLAEFTCGRLLFRLRGLTVGELAGPELEHASRTSTVVFERDLGLATEVSSDGGTTWLGPFASELNTTVTSRFRHSLRLGIEL
jgi:hypothetical protein